MVDKLFDKVLKFLRLCVILQQIAGIIFLFDSCISRIAISGHVYIPVLGVAASRSGHIADISLGVPVALENGRPFLHGYVHPHPIKYKQGSPGCCPKGFVLQLVHRCSELQG
jgi:hypothetical protein